MATPWNWSGSSGARLQPKPDVAKPLVEKQKPAAAENSNSRARLLKLGRAKEPDSITDNNCNVTIGTQVRSGRKFSNQPVQTDETLERLWVAGQHDEVQKHLLKGKNGSAAAARLIAFQKAEIAELRLSLRATEEKLRAQEAKTAEVMRFIEEQESLRAAQDVARIEDENAALDEAMLRAQAAEAAASVEKEKRMLLEAALSRMLKDWESRQVDMLVSRGKNDEGDK
jgi:hypothetical protein